MGLPSLSQIVWMHIIYLTSLGVSPRWLEKIMFVSLSCDYGRAGRRAALMRSGYTGLIIVELRQPGLHLSTSIVHATSNESIARR